MLIPNLEHLDSILCEMFFIKRYLVQCYLEKVKCFHEQIKLPKLYVFS
jgi:hypothetical protein